MCVWSRSVAIRHAPTCVACGTDVSQVAVRGAVEGRAHGLPSHLRLCLRSVAAPDFGGRLGCMAHSGCGWPLVLSRAVAAAIPCAERV